MTTLLTPLRSRSSRITLALCLGIGVIGVVVDSACVSVLDLTPGTLINPEGGAAAGCAPGHASCTAEVCATDLSSDSDHCGDCNVKCGGDHAQAACDAGKCTIACAPGFLSCDGFDTNGCEVEVATNPSHCGRCGHDCLGARCDLGVCQTRPFVDGDAPIRALRVTPTALFALTGFAIRRFALDTGASQLVAGPTELYAEEITTIGEAAYATKTVDGGAEVVRFDVVGDGGGVVDAGGDAAAAPLFPAPTCIVPMHAAVTIGSDDTSLYLAFTASPSNDTIVRVNAASTCAVEDTTPITNNQPTIAALAFDKDGLYWTAASGATTPGFGTVMRSRKDGTGIVLIVDKAKTPANLAVDDTHVYWMGGRGLSRIAKLATCPDEATCTELFAADATGALAIDDAAVYISAGDIAHGFKMGIRDKTSGADLGSVASPESISAIVTDPTSIYFAAGSRVFRVVR